MIDWSKPIRCRATKKPLDIIAIGTDIASPDWKVYTVKDRTTGKCHVVNVDGSCIELKDYTLFSQGVENGTGAVNVSKGDTVYFPYMPDMTGPQAAVVVLSVFTLDNIPYVVIQWPTLPYAIPASKVCDVKGNCFTGIM